MITATSADEALEALERFRPDALVSDIAMPDQDGYDLIREVRSREPERGGKIPPWRSPLTPAPKTACAFWPPASRCTRQTD